MRYLNNEQRQAIGYSYIVNNIDTATPVGTELKQNIRPYTSDNIKGLIQELEDTQLIMDRVLVKEKEKGDIEFALCKFKDLRGTFRKLNANQILDEVELFEIKNYAKLCNEIKNAFEIMKIEINGVGFHDLTDVFSLLDPDKLGIDTFYIYDSYSPELRNLRILRLKLEREISAISDFDLRNELLNNRSEIISKEAEIELDIRKDLSDSLKDYYLSFVTNTKSVARLDFILAKAKYFKFTGAIMPEVGKGIKFDINSMYNPYYQHIMHSKAKRHDMKKINISLSLGVTVLTGANMGGKSICMKTVALNGLLANMGMFVFGENPKVPILDYIYMVSDDLQSAESGLSTFGAEMIYLKKIVAASDYKDGLVLLDELARGTNPVEGRIIVQSTIKHFHNKASHTFISTHFDGIEYEGIKHLQVVGISNIDFKNLQSLIQLNQKNSLEIIQSHMDYSIVEVSNKKTPHNAIQIAKLLGLGEEMFG